MAARRCPLCGGNIANGECLACGYETPDLNAIAAPYDLDPSNDAFGEAESLFEEAESPDISDSGEPDMEAVAVPTVSAALNSSGRFASAAPQPIPNIKAAAPKAPPVPKAAPQQATTQNQPPVQNYGQATLFERFVKATADFFAKHWWKFLAVFLAPTSGLLIFTAYLGIFYVLDKKKPEVLAKGIMFGALGLFLMSQGLDLFALDTLLRQILNVIMEFLD